MIIDVKHTDTLYLAMVYSELSRLVQEYPSFEDWFFCKVVPGLNLGTRRIITVQDEDAIKAILIMKDSDEKKICTLRVAERYRNNGLGTFLLDYARQELKTNWPIITVSNNHIREFSRLFDKFSFKSPKIYHDFYTANSVEYCFNGRLNAN